MPILEMGKLRLTKALLTITQPVSSVVRWPGPHTPALFLCLHDPQLARPLLLSAEVWAPAGTGAPAGTQGGKSTGPDGDFHTCAFLPLERCLSQVAKVTQKMPLAGKGHSPRSELHSCRCPGPPSFGAGHSLVSKPVERGCWCL